MPQGEKTVLEVERIVKQMGLSGKMPEFPQTKEPSQTDSDQENDLYHAQPHESIAATT